MKRTGQLSIVLLSMMLLFSVLSLPIDFASAAGASFIPCDCASKTCQCFIQYGDEGGAVKQIIQLLTRKKYLPKGTPSDRFSQQVEEAVRKFQTDHQLIETGTMDDDTLTLLLWGMTAEELDVQQGSAPFEVRTVFIPTDGGKKRHLAPGCSQMEDPRKVSVRNAEALSFDPCKKCFKD